MKNFNVDIDDSSLNRQYRAIKLQFINQLKALDFIDSYNLIGQDDCYKSYRHTWQNVSNTIFSRIDYI